MRVLVTGGAGFIGSHLVDALEQRRDVVSVVDRKRGQCLDEITEALHALRWSADVIVHLAASCSTAGSITDPFGTFRDTVQTTANLFSALALLELRTPVIHTSSVKARDGRTPYGAAKLAAETWAAETGRTFGIPVVINRPGTVYGPGQQGSPESGWIAWFTAAKAAGRKVTVHGEGNQVRDLLHVSDYVRLLLAQIDDPARFAGRVWDVGGGLSNSVSVEQMVKHLGLEHDHDEDRYGDAETYIGLNNVPGWKPLVSWTQAL